MTEITEVIYNEIRKTIIGNMRICACFLYDIGMRRRKQFIGGKYGIITDFTDRRELGTAQL